MNGDLIRLATTESIFRNVNERIAESAQRFDADEAEFVCECDDRSCTHRLETSLDDYERVRARPTLPARAGARGRGDREGRRATPALSVVEKFERTVVATVRSLNPRKPKPA
jgi:hypothetical protein